MANEAIITNNKKFDLHVLQPLSNPSDQSHNTPIDFKKTYTVKPNGTCIFKVPSIQNDQSTPIFIYKKPIIKSIGQIENLYTWNGFDMDGGVFKPDTALEFNMYCHESVPVPMINTTFQLINDQSFTISCATNCIKANSEKSDQKIVYIWIRICFIV